MKDYISTEEAAAELGVTRQRVCVLIRGGRLKAKKIGEGNRATYLIDPADLEVVRNRKTGRPWKGEEPPRVKPVKKRKGSRKDAE